MRRTATYRSVGDYIVFVHSEESPSDGEWTLILGGFREQPDLRRVRVLVFTYCGAPNARQRAELNEILEKVRPPVAIVTPSALARAAGTAIGWFNPHIRLFSPEQMDEALTYLDAGEVDRRRLLSALEELKREVRRHSSKPPPANPAITR
jgi:hypothetical protein